MKRSELVQLLARLEKVNLIVLGDYFLDYYLHIERKLSEISVETDLEAYQVVSVVKNPGAAGTVVSNLRSLQVNVTSIGLIGDDGNGFELQKRLRENKVNCSGLVTVPGYDTPTYMKPMMHETDGSIHELNRMDVKRRTEIPSSLEDNIIEKLRELLPAADGLLIVDQVKERNCGNITDRVRDEIKALSIQFPGKIISADSRDYISLYESIMIKSNINEVMKSVCIDPEPGADLLATADKCGRQLSGRTGKPVIVTLGNKGLYLINNQLESGYYLPSIPVTGPIDIVGAGDSVNASIGAALCSGASLVDAGILGNIVASIVIQQIGTTGTASPAHVLAQFDKHPEVAYIEQG